MIGICTTGTPAFGGHQLGKMHTNREQIIALPRTQTSEGSLPAWLLSSAHRGFGYFAFI